MDLAEGYIPSLKYATLRSKFHLTFEFNNYILRYFVFKTEMIVCLEL